MQTEGAIKRLSFRKHSGRFLVSNGGSRWVDSHPGGHVDADLFKQVVEISTPGYGHYYIANGIFKDQRPSNDPGDDLTKTSHMRRCKHCRQWVPD